MSVHVILGPMFSGKSTRIREIGLKYVSIHANVLLITHPGARSENPPFSVCCVQSLTDVVSDQYGVILIDEAQFYDGLVDFVRKASEDHGKIVYVAGLDGDYQRAKFGQILDCIPLADTVEKLAAFCTLCADGTPGLFTRRKVPIRDQQIVVGGADMYMPLCRECYLQTCR